MSVVMWQNISGGTEKGVEKVGRGSGFKQHHYDHLTNKCLEHLEEEIVPRVDGAGQAPMHAVIVERPILISPMAVAAGVAVRAQKRGLRRVEEAELPPPPARNSSTCVAYISTCRPSRRVSFLPKGLVVAQSPPSLYCPFS